MSKGHLQQALQVLDQDRVIIYPLCLRDSRDSTLESKKLDQATRASGSLGLNRAITESKTA
jgi:hypothetical protein